MKSNIYIGYYHIFCYIKNTLMFLYTYISSPCKVAKLTLLHNNKFLKLYLIDYPSECKWIII